MAVFGRRRNCKETTRLLSTQIKYGVLSWESKYGNPTPFIAEVEEEETILKPAYDYRGMYDMCNVDVGGKCALFKTNKGHDCIIVNTRFFMQGLELKDV